jgi:hypothetical protein
MHSSPGKGSTLAYLYEMTAQLLLSRGCSGIQAGPAAEQLSRR